VGQVLNTPPPSPGYLTVCVERDSGPPYWLPGPPRDRTESPYPECAGVVHTLSVMARINAADWSDTTNKKSRERERERDSSLLLLLPPLILPRGSIPFFPPSLHGQRTLCVCVGSSSTVRPFLYTPNILDGKIQDNEVTDTHTRKRLTRSSHDFYIFSKIFPTKNTMRIIILYFGVSCVEIHTQRERAPVKLRDTSSSSPPPPTERKKWVRLRWFRYR
jgi:hypothetical protein